jgi:DNA-binding CsgD family transcriptional regulator
MLILGNMTENSKILSEALLRLYEPPPGCIFFEHVLSLLEDHIEFSISGYGITCLEAQKFNEKLIRNSDGRSRPSDPEIERLVRLHPFFDCYLKNNNGPVLCTTDVMSEKEWKQTEVYNELHRKYGVIHDVSLRFYHGSSCINFYFSDTVELAPESRLFLTLMAPHLSTAHRAHILQKRDLLGNIAGNMVLLTTAGNLVECPAAAHGLLTKYYPHEKKTVGMDLPHPVKNWIQQNIGKDGPPTDLVARDQEGSLLLKLLRLPKGYLLLLEESASKNPFEVLRGMGLTAREAEVLIWVAQGKQNSEAALILGISTATVRKHMEHILQKLGCENRGAAVQMFMQTVSEQTAGHLPAKCLTCMEPTCSACVSR